MIHDDSIGYSTRISTQTKLTKKKKIDSLKQLTLSLCIMIDRVVLLATLDASAQTIQLQIKTANELEA